MSAFRWARPYTGAAGAPSIGEPPKEEPQPTEEGLKVAPVVIVKTQTNPDGTVDFSATASDGSYTVAGKSVPADDAAATIEAAKAGGQTLQNYLHSREIRGRERWWQARLDAAVREAQGLPPVVEPEAEGAKVPAWLWLGGAAVLGYLLLAPQKAKP